MGAKVPFDREAFGYNRVQVDSYLKLLTDAYHEVFCEYEKAVAQNARLKTKNEAKEAFTFSF